MTGFDLIIKLVFLEGIIKRVVVSSRKDIYFVISLRKRLKGQYDRRKRVAAGVTAISKGGCGCLCALSNLQSGELTTQDGFSFMGREGRAGSASESDCDA